MPSAPDLTYKDEEGLTLNEGHQPRKRVGKPRIEVDINQVETLAAQGMSMEQIAYALGINVKTLSDRKRRYVEFAEAIRRGQAKGIASVTNALFQSAMKGNYSAQQFYLKNRDPDGWKDRFDDDGPMKEAIGITIDQDDADL